MGLMPVSVAETFAPLIAVPVAAVLLAFKHKLLPGRQDACRCLVLWRFDAISDDPSGPPVAGWECDGSDEPYLH